MPDRTNVVFILTDDQGPWAMGCAGNGEIRTPNLDRLAEQGTRFENFFCTSPVCSPARATRFFCHATTSRRTTSRTARPSPSMAWTFLTG